jgi:hypothetical protein
LRALQTAGITEFDVPGTGTGAGQGTAVICSNISSGAVAGTYIDGNNVLHGFLWIPCDDECDDKSESVAAPILQ